MKAHTADWSEATNLIHQQLIDLKESLSDKKFDKADELIDKMKLELNLVLDWIKQARPTVNVIVGSKQEEDYLPPRHPMHPVEEEVVRLVPTMQLRWVYADPALSLARIRYDGHPLTLQQWYKDISTPDAAGHYPHGEWINVPLEIAKWK
jgi:hypothetical protein